MLDRVRVFGPAYLDRVIRTDGPILGDANAPPLDQSVGGRPGFGNGQGLTLVDPEGASLAIAPPGDWPGPWGVVDLDRPLGAAPGSRRELRALGWRDDLGGMGAGFAAALGGVLVSAVGPEDDPTSEAVARLLDRHGVVHRPIRTGPPADWTLLLSSAEHGDKLAVGFRGCHDALAAEDLAPCLADPPDVLIVAGLPNRPAVTVLNAPGPRLRVLAPSIRNTTDPETPLRALIAPVDVLCCNRGEWEALEDREEVAARLSILVVTEGAAGSTARFTDPQGGSRRIRIPAFRRSRPPLDVNRAGEAFASFFIRSMLEAGWRPESCTAEVEMVRGSMIRASAASALVLDLGSFGFPSPAEVDAAAARGLVD